MRRLIFALLAGFLVAACAGSPDTYPLPSEPGGGASSPVQVGVPLNTVVVFIQVRPGDQIELLGAEPVGLANGATMKFYLSRPVLRPTGETVIGEDLETLEGAKVSAVSASPGPENTVGIVAELTAQRAGRYQLTNVRLHYRLNGRERSGEGIDVVWTVCADDPAPASCS